METLRAVSRWVRAAPPPTPDPSPRPFWVTSGGGGARARGVLAATLGELREQAGWALSLPPPVALALAQDGTLVEDEAFFGTLPPHTPLVVLGPGEKWDPQKAGGSLVGVAPPPPPGGSPGGPPELARLSLILGDPPDPRGGGGAGGGGARRLRLSAQIRGVRWDLGGLGPDRMVRELLRLLTTLTRLLGRTLLGVSAALRPLLEGPPTPEPPRGGR